MRKIFAPLLVLALLACHGAYGAAEHRYLFELAGATDGHAPHAEQLPADGGPQAHGWDADAAGYAAAGLVAAIAAIMWVRLRDVLLRRGTPIPRRYWTRRAPPLLLLPRAPRASSLQVYRL